MRLHKIEGIFPGDRAGKVRARAEIYETFQQALGARRFLRSNHFVLGGDGGDIELLLSAGVSPKNIFVIDHEARLITRLRKKFPGCRFMPTDMGDAAILLSREHVEFGTLNLDLCSNIYNSVLMQIVTVLHLLMGPSTCVAVTVRADREREFEALTAVEHAKTKVPLRLRNYTAALSRAYALHSLLKDNGISEMQAWGYYGYRSTGKGLGGGPCATNMAVLLGGGAKLRNPWGRRRFHIDQEKDMKKESALENHTKENAAHLVKQMDMAGLNTEELSKKTGVSRATISNLRCARLPRRRRDYWVKLMKALAPRSAAPKTKRGPQQRNDSELRAALQKLHDNRHYGWETIARAARVDPKTLTRLMNGESVQPRVAQLLNTVVAELRAGKKSNTPKKGDDFDFEIARFEKLDALYSRAHTPDQKRRVAAMLVA